MLGDVHSDILAKLMDVASLRAKVHAANIANQNTPGYKSQAVAFEGAFREALASGASGESLAAINPEVYTPEDSSEQADGNNVAVDREVLDQAQNNTLYNTYIGLAQGRKKLLTLAVSSAPGG